MTVAYYNEFDPVAAEWLRNLINAGRDVPGIVDDRSIEDVRPDDLTGFTQCHFFAGIGVWSYALRAAGWPDHRRVWTASCPCQPFSAAGKGAGFDDDRHLYPALSHLVRECKPATILGEQVASGDANAWIDLVHADMESMDYAFGCVPFPSAGVGAPHIRDRAYWLAYASGEGQSQQQRERFESARLATNGLLVRLESSSRTGLEGLGGGYQAEGGRDGAFRPVAAPSEFGRVADASGERFGRRQGVPHGRINDRSDAGRIEGDNGSFGVDETCVPRIGLPGPTNGFWRDADWLGCRDGKWRPVEPGSFPLAHGATSRVGRLRAYGNAINAEAARVFIQSVMSVVD